MSKSDDVKKDLGKNMAASAGLSGGASGVPASIPKRELPAKDIGRQRSTDVFEINLDRIIADPDQPRQDFDVDSIRRMAGSLRKRGQLMPITVRWSESHGKWMIVSGERRYRGAVMAGLKSLKAVDRSSVTDTSDIQSDQLLENLQREELRGIDAARGYRRLMELNSWSANELAKELHLSQSNVVQTLAILDTSPVVQEMVALEEISPSSAYELSKIADKAVQDEVAAKVVEGGLKRDEVRAEVARAVSRGGVKNPGKGRGGAAKGKPRPLKPWVFKGMDGIKLTVEFGKKGGFKSGMSTLVEAQEKYRAEHPDAVA